MMTKLPRNATFWLFCLTGLYAAVLAAITVVNRFGADNWWFGALNLFLPQAIWAVPGVVLTLLFLRAKRTWVWVPLLCLVWVVGPVMGLCWPLHSPPASADHPPMRIMTWNVKYRKHENSAHVALIGDIERHRPDVVLLQEAQGSQNGILDEYFRTWHVRSFGQFIIASRLPLSESEVCQLSSPGKETSFLRCKLYSGATVITLYNVHFQSPREGLNAFRSVKKRPWYLPEAIQRFEYNVSVRLSQARSLLEFLRQEQGPVIVAGDLNSPDASLACWGLRGVGLHDAFAEGGKGYGYTYGHNLLQHRLPWFRIPWMRIDHVMLSPHLQTLRSWTGTMAASEHRPVIADVVVKGP